MPKIITISPFRMQKFGDKDLIIPTERKFSIGKNAEYVNDPKRKDYTDYCRYALICNGTDNDLSFGTSAEELGKNISLTQEFPEMETGIGFALNFSNPPFNYFQYQGQDFGNDKQRIYLCHKFNSQERKSFINGLSKGKDSWKRFKGLNKLLILDD